jgi:uncharacterized damage-inducible protein DinB
MLTKKDILNEFLLETQVTRRFLEIVPFDKKDYKPSEKSETLGRLAIHVAEIIAWWTSVIKTNKLDFKNFEPEDIKSKDALLTYFDNLVIKAKESILDITDDILEDEWSMTNGNEIYFTLPKKQVLRLFCMNHLIHHRSQLGVYLRMLDISVPASYGPSADDDLVILEKKYN